MVKKIAIALSLYYAIYLVLSSFVEPFTWFGKEGETVQRVGIWGHLALVLLPALFILAYYSWQFRKKVLLNKYLGIESVSIGQGRDDAFHELRTQAKHHIIIVGVGMTRIASFDMRSVSEQATRVPISFLMIDPDFLNQNHDFAETLEEFLDYPDFAQNVQTSFNSLKSFCEEWNNDPNHRFKLSLKVYKTVPTACMVLIDPEQVSGQVIIEFFLYQSGARRPRLHVRKIQDPNSLFERINLECQRLWDRSRRVV